MRENLLHISCTISLVSFPCGKDLSRTRWRTATELQLKKTEPLNMAGPPLRYITSEIDEALIK